MDNSDSEREVANTGGVLSEESVVGGDGGGGGDAERQPAKDVLNQDSNSSRKNEELYAVHRDQFEKLLPEDAWRYFLGTLMDSPEELENCANSSPYFWELVQEQRCLFLFPKVIKVLAQMYEDQAVSCRQISSEIDVKSLKLPNVTLGRDSDKKWRTAVLNCRLACSSWNKTVEQCYQQPEMIGMPEFVKDLSPTSKLITMRTSFINAYELIGDTSAEIVKQFESTHSGIDGAPPKNPILGRYVTIAVHASVSLPTDFHDAQKKLLMMFGREIWYCEVVAFTQYIKLDVQLIQKLNELLRLMPNLKSLQIRFPSIENYSVGPCPDLPKLEKLQLIELNNVPTLIANQLLKANSHVTILDLQLTEIDEDIASSLVNLEKFKGISTTSGRRTMRTSMPSWKKLSSLRYESDFYVEMGAESFTFLHTNWANTLTDLQLSFPFKWVEWEDEKIFSESKTLRLELPCIRRLSLTVMCWFFLDFALPMKKSLEHLEIYTFLWNYPKFNEDRDWMKKEENIELVRFENELNKSNIWRIFDKLKTIKKFHMFGKKGWILYTKENKFVYWKKDE